MYAGVYDDAGVLVPSGPPLHIRAHKGSVRRGMGLRNLGSRSMSEEEQQTLVTDAGHFVYGMARAGAEELGKTRRAFSSNRIGRDVERAELYASLQGDQEASPPGSPGPQPPPSKRTRPAAPLRGSASCP